MAAPAKFNPHPFAYHQELDLVIDNLTNLGLGVGRVDGWVVMVPRVIVGETVRVRVFRNHKNYSEADLVEVLSPSPQRREPGCPLFGECGGCQYQHIPYAEQLRIKEQHVREVYTKIAGMEKAPVEPTMGSPIEFGYRSKLTPHYPGNKPERELPIGFLRWGSRRHVVDVPHCPIASDSINAALPAVREHRRKDPPKRGGTLLLRDHAGGVSTDPREIVEQSVDRWRFRHPAGEFFQNNPHVLVRLLEETQREARRHPTPFLIDAYCGSGLFSIALSNEFERVWGIEIADGLVARTTENAKLNQVTNTEFVCGDATSIFADLTIPGSETTLLVDPPRRGCSPEFLEQVRDFLPVRILYVSCDPATQARDVRILADYGYHLDRVLPVDLFPQTRHIESLATLSLRPS